MTDHKPEPDPFVLRIALDPTALNRATAHLNETFARMRFRNAARAALTACLSHDDDNAALALDGLDDAQLYAIEGAASALAIHASRLRKDPAGDGQPREWLGASCTGTAYDEITGVDRLAPWERDLLTAKADEQAEQARPDADHARRWEQADAEMTAMRQRAETAERRLDIADRLAAALKAERDRVRRERDEARSALDYGAERLYKQLGDATRRADEQKARAQRAEADAADWRTTARQADGRLVKLRRLANQQDYVRAADILAILHQDATETLHNIIGEDPDKFRSWLRDEIRRDPGWWREILRRELRLGWLREDFRRAGLGD